MDYGPPPTAPGARRWIVAATGCVVSWVVGLVVGGIAANVFQRAMYPPEPDSVHFDVGGVLLLVWALIGLLGSVLFIGRAVWRARTAAE